MRTAGVRGSVRGRDRRQWRLIAVFFMWRWARRIVTAFSLALVAVIAVPMLRIEWTGHRQDHTPSDAIVVFGAAQFDGTPSPVLRNRLDHGLTLYRAGVADRIVTVGGNRPGDRFTEATAGRNYLHAQGVPWDRLKAVKAGSDTYSSAAAVAAWARDRGIASFTVVSDRAHVARASTMLHSLGFEVHTSAPQEGPGSAMTWQYVARETAGMLRFWIFGDSDFGTSLRGALDSGADVATEAAVDAVKDAAASKAAEAVSGG